MVLMRPNYPQLYGVATNRGLSIKDFALLVDDEPNAGIGLAVPLAPMDRNRERELVSDLKGSTSELAEKPA
ncbi:MAG: hypothetical protein AAF750_15815 [Planctomycetota bacterium]